MTRGRKPRRPRYVSNDPMRLARNSATKLTAKELAMTIDPIRESAKRMREGVGSEVDWSLLASAANCAKAIERQGIVHGLAEHFAAAEAALNAISQRALAGGDWRATALYYQELEHINALVDLHEYQLQQLSYGEAHQAVKSATAAIRQNGGAVAYVDQIQEPLL